MNGIPAEVKFLDCAQIWSDDAKSNLHLGIRLSNDVKVVAGDIVDITHIVQQKRKSGKMTVVCVERRKDKLYLVGVPDKEEVPPPHAGPNRLAPYYSCPLLVCFVFCFLLFLFLLLFLLWSNVVVEA